jgi:hypothetical protein
MSLRTLSNITGKILIVGSIYDKIEKLNNIDIDDYFIVIINGNALYPWHDFDLVKTRIHDIDNLLKTNKIIYNVGNYDLKLGNILFNQDTDFDVQNWIFTKPHVISITFMNSAKYLVMSGGITSDITSLKQMNDDYEISFISYVNQKPWQTYYNGMLGHIVSNCPHNTTKPTIFPHATQIGTKYSEKNTVFALEISDSGLKNIIEL